MINKNSKNNINASLIKNKTELKINSILDAFFEYGAPCVTIKDLLSFTSTCTLLKKRTYTKYNGIKKIHLLSTSLFHRFVSEAQKIDRTDTPKFTTEILNSGNEYGMIHYEIIEQSQRVYEIHYLESAYEKASNVQIRLFHTLSNRERNELLDVINKIDLDQLNFSGEINALSISHLIYLYKDIKQKYPKLESILLETDIFTRRKEMSEIQITNKIFSLISWLLEKIH